MANQPKKYQKFVATAATATLVATAVVPAASAADTTFSDISSYATEVQEEVLFLADLGVINGFEDGTFKPAQNITRGQAVKMIGRFLEAQGVEAPENWATEQSFSDIAVDRTDRDLVKYAALVKEAGVFQGNGNVLNPSGFTTRENMALILDRLIGQLTGKTAVELAEGLENNVSDLANAKEEAREAIAALNALGVSNAEEFKPKNNTQRVHFASFLARMIELADQQTAEPAIESVEALSKTKVVVTFNTPVDEVTAENFTIEGAVVNGVELSEDKTVATLDVSGLEYNTEYTVAVADVKVDGEAVDFGSQSFKTPSVTQDFELRVTAADAEVVADGADNVVVKFELLNSLGEVDTNADNMVLEIASTFGNLATNRVTIQDGVGQVVLSSEFSSKEIVAKVTAQVIEASTDYKDLIGKVAGETTVKFVPAASVLDPNALTFLGAESNQADRVVVYFDKPVSPATFMETKEDGTFQTTYNSDFDVFIQNFKDEVEIKVTQGTEKQIVGLAAVPGNDKAIEIILAKNTATKNNNILKDNDKVNLQVKIGQTTNNREFTLTDARKPEFTGVTVADLRTLDLKFSEAVVDGKFSIDGIWTQGEGNEFNVEFGDFDAETGVDKRDTATLVLNEKNAKQLYFQAGQHSITVTQLQDFASATDNANISTTQTLNFNVFADLTPPTATVEVESPEQFRVTFNKYFAIASEYISDHSLDVDVDVDGDGDVDVDDVLSYVFNNTLRVYDAVNKDWVTLDKLTVDGKTAGKKVFDEAAIQNLLVAKQASDEKGKVNEVVVELQKDWTELFNDKTSNSKDTYNNYQFKFDIDARTFENAANGIMNSSFDLNLNYEGSPLNAADNASPVIDDIKVTKKENEFEVFLNEPVKLSTTLNGVGDSAGDTPSLSNTGETVPVPKVLVVFQGKDANGKAVVVEAKVDGYSSTTDKDGDSVLKVSTLGKDTLQKLVNAGYDPNWKVVVRSVSDDIGNTAATLTKDFSLVANLVERPFHIESDENTDPLTKLPYENKVKAVDFEPGVDANGVGYKDRLEVTFTKAVNFAGNDNLTSVYNWTLNGRKLSELSNVESIKLVDVPGEGRTNDYETVVITFADANAFAKQSNVVSVTKGIKSLDGTVLTGEYEVVSETVTPVQYDAWRALKAAEKINALPSLSEIYQGDSEVVVAVAYYNALTSAQKALVPQAAVDALVLAAEKAGLVKDAAPVVEPGFTLTQLADQVETINLEDLDLDLVSKSVAMFNALTREEQLNFPAEQLKKLQDAALATGIEIPQVKAEENDNGDSNLAPVVKGTVSLVAPTTGKETTVKGLGATLDDIGIGGKVAITVPNSTLPAEFQVTINGVTYDGSTDEGTSTIVADSEGLTADTKITAEGDLTFTSNVERVAVNGTNVSITLQATDDLEALSKLAKGELSENATAKITTPEGTELTTELTSATPITEILAFLNSKGVKAESLIGSKYTVVLVDKVDAALTTTYTIQF